MHYPNGQYLVETGWLESNLSDPDLRVIDCRMNFTIDESGDIQFSSAKDDWASRHIPGAAYVDIRDEMSLRPTDLPFMLPSADDFAEVMSRLGVAPKHVGDAELDESLKRCEPAEPSRPAACIEDDGPTP